jgi:transcriptional regulator with PAS, ATPase and Fis domain
MQNQESYFFPNGLPNTRTRGSKAAALPTMPPLSPKIPSQVPCNLSVDPFAWFWGSSQFRSQILEDLAIAAHYPIHSLIVGESGSGKEIIAREIHRLRAENLARKTEDLPFVAINCAAIPESLAESLLFGHERGAFTSARDKQAGKFEQAQDGILFLDEVQNLSLTLQAKLLRVIQFAELDRLGSKKPIKINCKIIAACNVPLELLVERGLFRKDLYYRLNVMPVYLPALRDRSADLKSIAEGMIQKVCQQYHLPQKLLTPSAVDAIRSYDWPGNLRELEHALLHASLKSKKEMIEVSDLPIMVLKAGRAFLQEGRWDIASVRH